MNNMTLNIFVSYNRKDISYAQEVEKLLHANGLMAWRDLEFLPFGVDTESEIRRAITEDCKAFILLITENSMNSDFIWKVEIDEAVKKTRRENSDFLIIPVFYKKELLPSFSDKSIKQFGENLSNQNGQILEGNDTDLNIHMLQKMIGRILESLIYKEDFTRIKIYTHGEIPTSQYPELIVDLRDSFKNSIPSECEWKNVILPALNNIKKAMLHKKKPQTQIWLPRRIHLSAALVFGWVFRENTGFEFLPSDILLQENPEISYEKNLLIPMKESIIKGDNRKNNIAVLVSLTKDVRPTVQRLVEVSTYRYKSCVQLSMDKIASDSIINTTHAKQLAKQTVEALLRQKDLLKTTHTDLFISASVQYVAYLGYYLNACGSFEFWQYSMLEDIYKPSVSLSVLFDHDT